jgi:tryptophanyl-tRNA synthetase
MATYLSGIQPSGQPHLGNYFGALRQHVALTALPGEHYYFIADYHALTSSKDPADLRARVHDVALTYLALGLDPQRAALFRQSDVPEVTELAWLLACTSGMGLLERSHAYKDKVAHGIKPSVGLFTYPVLMAADVLAYDSDFVPVGRDQLQHVEMAQDMGGSFNALYGEVFHRPEPKLPSSESEAKVPGLDGEKMSKSYGNTLWIFEHGKPLQKAIGRIVTDSRPPEEPKDPDSLVLCQLLRLLLAPQEYEQLAASIRVGGPGAPGYGHLKQHLQRAFEAHFADARARRDMLLANPEIVTRALESGARRARAVAQRTRDRALAACGLR